MNGKEMNEIELSNLIWIFKIKEWKALFGSSIEGNEWNHFMTILLLDFYFKINGWVYGCILRVLVKKFIKSNFIPSHFSQFWGNKNLRF